MLRYLVTRHTTIKWPIQIFRVFLVLSSPTKSIRKYMSVWISEKNLTKLYRGNYLDVPEYNKQTTAHNFWTYGYLLAALHRKLENATGKKSFLENSSEFKWSILTSFGSGTSSLVSGGALMAMTVLLSKSLIPRMSWYVTCAFLMQER